VAVRPEVYGRRQREAWVVGSVALLLPPLFTQGIYGLGVCRLVLIFCLIALGYWVQFAIAGSFSLCTAVFYANGAYLSTWGTTRGGFPVAFGLAVVGTGLLGALLKRMLWRCGIVQFGIATLAFGAMMPVVYGRWRGLAGGGQGRFLLPPARLFGYRFDTPVRIYLLVATVVIVTVLALVLLQRSPVIRDQIFVRDMHNVARVAGVRARYVQVLGFGLGAGIMGAAGSMYEFSSRFVHPSAFGAQISLDVLLMVLVGGIGSPWGAVVGAVLFTLMPVLLHATARYRDLIEFGGIVLVVLAMPEGLISLPRLAIRAWGRRRLGQSSATS